MIDTMEENVYPHAAVVFANDYQFSPRQEVTYPAVKSRMLLWCRSGLGEVAVNGQRLPLAAEDFLVLPWNHAIHYRADGRDPFFVGAVHTIPHHETSQEVAWGVSHNPTDKLAPWTWRRDEATRAFAEVRRGNMARNEKLIYLVEYIIRWFQSEKRETWRARMLGGLLLSEVEGFWSGRRDGQDPFPPELRRVLQYISDHLEGEISLEKLTRIAGCSRSSLERLFSSHLGRSPLNQLRHSRMERAKLLLTTSHQPIGAVARRSGIADPYHFSKLFRSIVGCTPSEYRDRNLIF